jgi:hypothetical protein
MPEIAKPTPEELAERKRLAAKERLPIRIAKLHNIFMHLGKPGLFMVKGLALYSLYVVFTNGGFEALSVICHQYILDEVYERKTNGVNASRTTSTTSSTSSSKN